MLFIQYFVLSMYFCIFYDGLYTKKKRNYNVVPCSIKITNFN